MSAYKVGYGQPPKNRQFKKGQSGNPKGRPKKKIVAPLVDASAILLAPVTVKHKGVARKMSLNEIIVRTLIRRALNENHRASLKKLSNDLMGYSIIKQKPYEQQGGVIHMPHSWFKEEEQQMDLISEVKNDDRA